MFVYFRYLSKAGGFQLTPRSRGCLPQGFPTEIEGTCHFLNSYIFPFVDESEQTSVNHIGMAIDHYKIKEVTQ